MRQISFPLDVHARVLFVDDDPILVEFAKVHLTSPVATVASAANGADAWEKLQTADYDLVVLDLEMPVMDGFGLLEKIRSESAFDHMPVVVLTGREDVASIDRSFQLGAQSFDTKPINWRALGYKLRYVLRASRNEADLWRQRERSEELARLTNNLLSLIRVETRTPLDAIIGYSECIAKEIDGPIERRRYVDYAEQIGLAARQMQERFIDLIQYAQLSCGHATLAFDEYSARSLAESVVAGMSAAATPALSLLEGGEGLHVLCDRHWLTRALSHMLDDARSREGVEAVEFCVGRAVDGGLVFSLVARRARTSPARSGANYSLEAVRVVHGLGIPFARRIGELHDGRLVESVNAAGDAVLTLALPQSRVIEPRRPTPQPREAQVA
jgi:CheY-like chemotaxis protein